MAVEFPRVRGIPSCINLSTWVQGMSDYELLCEVIQVVNKLSELASLSVITYADPLHWNITTQYSANTIVVDPETGVAYLSKQPVPAGVQLTNDDYWIPIFDLTNFTDYLRDAIASFDIQHTGQPATVEIPSGTVFWCDNQLVYAPNDIPTGTVVIPGSNCTPITVIDLINEVYNTAYAVYEASTTTIKLGWVRTGPDPSPAYCDTHSYNQLSETIRISAVR